MSSFSILARLGICRAWRLRGVKYTRFYAATLIHCLFIFTLLRAKLFRNGFWTVSYFIFCLLKKYIVHIVFWRLLSVKKNKFFRTIWALSVIVRMRRVSGVNTPIKFTMGLSRIHVYRNWRAISLNTGKNNNLYAILRPRELINFWWFNANRVNQFLTNYCRVLPGLSKSSEVFKKIC